MKLCAECEYMSEQYEYSEKVLFVVVFFYVQSSHEHVVLSASCKYGMIIRRLSVRR